MSNLEATAVPGEVLTLHPAGGLGAVPETGTLRFRLIKDIGGSQGRSSEVFLGEDLQLNATFAYKRMPIAKMASPDMYWEEARRLHEARHRHVVPIKYACETPTHVYMAMPYFPAGSLHTRLDAGPMTVREVVRCGLEFLMGLHHAHVRNVVHFDVKPSNVFFDSSGAATLADFGLSRVVGGLGLAEQPSYYRSHMVPEREYTATLTKASDVYQSALTLYRMCIGNAAWSAAIAALGGKNSSKFTDAVVKGAFPDRKALPLHVPSTLKSLIRRGLEVDPDKRTATALDLLLELAAVDKRLDWQWTRVSSTHDEWRLKREQATIRVTLREVSEGKWWAEAHREGAYPARLTKRCLENASLLVAKKHVEGIMGGEDGD